MLFVFQYSKPSSVLLSTVLCWHFSSLISFYPAGDLGHVMVGKPTTQPMEKLHQKLRKRDFYCIFRSSSQESGCFIYTTSSHNYCTVQQPGTVLLPFSMSLLFGLKSCAIRKKRLQYHFLIPFFETFYLKLQTQKLDVIGFNSDRWYIYISFISPLLIQGPEVDKL